MNGHRRLLPLFLVALSLGCRPPPSLHEIVLLSPTRVCDETSPARCLPYIGCDDLGIRKISISVGPTYPEDTTLICLYNAIGYIMKVYYQPGDSHYTIDANYARKGMDFSISAGPFGEDQTLTPWTLYLQ